LKQTEGLRLHSSLLVKIEAIFVFCFLAQLLSRGNKCRDIFIDEKDHSDFLEAVGEMSQRFDIEYLLMF